MLPSPLFFPTGKCDSVHSVYCSTGKLFTRDTTGLPAMGSVLVAGIGCCDPGDTVVIDAAIPPRLTTGFPSTLRSMATVSAAFVRTSNGKAESTVLVFQVQSPHSNEPVVCGAVTLETYQTLRVTRLESQFALLCMVLCTKLTGVLTAIAIAWQWLIDKTCPGVAASRCTPGARRSIRPVMFVSLLKTRDANRAMGASPRISRVTMPGNVLTVLAHMAILAAPVLQDDAPLASIAMLRAADETAVPYVVQDLLVYAAVVTQLLRDVEHEAPLHVFVDGVDESKPPTPGQSMSIVQSGRPDMQYCQSKSIHKMKRGQCEPKAASPSPGPGPGPGPDPGPVPRPTTVAVRVLQTGSPSLVSFEPIKWAREW